MGASQFGQELTQEEEDMLVIQMDETFNPEPERVTEMTRKKYHDQKRKQMRENLTDLMSVRNDNLINTPNLTSPTGSK